MYRGNQIRTDDILLPKQTLYQAELHPECDKYNKIFCLLEINLMKNMVLTDRGNQIAKMFTSFHILPFGLT